MKNDKTNHLGQFFVFGVLIKTKSEKTLLKIAAFIISLKGINHLRTIVSINKNDQILFTSDILSFLLNTIALGL